MPISTSDLDGLPDYTDAQLLKAYRKCAVDIALGGTAVGIDGRTLSRADLDKVKGMIEWLEARVQSASDGEGGNIALGVFGEDQ